MNKFVSSLTEDTLAIFLLHGVTQSSCYKVRNYTGKHVRESEFVDIMRSLKNVGVPLSMDDIARLHQEGTPYPPRSFAITFDDGFANNYTIAAPILKDLGIPATFYVTTGWIESNGMSWLDRLEYCLENTSAGAVHLPWENMPRVFATSHQKINIMNEIRYHIKRIPGIDIESFVMDIFDQCGCELIKSSDSPLDLKMNWKQVKGLNSDSGFTVAGHTHTHAILSFLDSDELDRELNLSMSLLMSRAGIGPKHYSYPEGQIESYNETVIRELKRRGVVCCPSAIDGVNTGEESLFDLRRIMIG